VLGKDGEAHLGRWWEKRRVTNSSGGQEYHIEIKRMKAKQIGHTLSWNCLLKHFPDRKVEGRTKVTGR
jgi:hypothetical protein